MGWVDDFGYLNAALQQGYVGSQPRAIYRRPYRPAPGSGYDPWDASRPSAPNWLDFSTRAAAPGAPASPASSGPRGVAKPASAPERINVSLGYSGAQPSQGPAPSTKDDFLGSLGASIGDTLGSVNPMNAIPWLMERVDVLSTSLADEVDTQAKAGNPLAGAVQSAVKASPFHLFGEGLKTVSAIVSPALEALPNMYRDDALNDKAMVYAAIVKGETLGPLEQFGLAGNLIPGSTVGAKSNYEEYLPYHRFLIETMDPRARQVAQDRINILLDSIDLPDSVKAALNRDPNANAAKLLDEAPEGRQFSYSGGPDGVISNLGYPLLFYLAEAKGLGTVGGKLRLGPGVAWGDIGAAASGGARAQAIAAGGIKLVSQATTAAAKLQKVALVSGATYLPLALGFDTAARFTGDEGAVDWWEKVNRTAIISDKPSVQLLTSFTVNPFEAVGALKRGVVRLAHGAGDITVGRVAGRRLAAYYDHNDLLNDQIARMYRLGSRDEAARFIEENLGGRGAAFDQVVGLSLQTVIQRLPEAERAVLAALDSAERLRVGLETHGGEVMRLLEKDPELLASRWYSEFWQDRQMPGRFDPEVAALMSRDYQAATARTYQARQRMAAVVGRADYIPPHGLEVARAWLDHAAAADGTIPIRGIGGLQDLQRQLPALGRYAQGLIPAGAGRIGRTAVDTMLERAELDYAGLAKRNPVRAATAADPVLMPHATGRDYAEALGTTDEAVREWMDFKPGGPVDHLRAFIGDKVGLGAQQIAAMAPDEVWAKASEYIDRVSGPWLETGKRVEAARRDILGVRDELARLQGLPRNARDTTHADRVVRLERDLGRLNELVRYATDPPVPFSEAVRAGRRESRAAAVTAHAEEMAVRRADALDALERLAAIEESQVVAAASAIGSGPWHELVRPTPINHVMAWAGGATPMSAAFRRRFAAYLRTAADGGVGRDSRGRLEAQATGLLTELGDHEAWDLFFRHPQAIDRMTRTQQRVARAAERGTGIDEYAAGYAGAREGMNATDAFLEDLTRAIDDRADILAGRSEYGLSRTAATKGTPPVWWSERVASLTDPASPTYDPEFAAITHPHNIGRVKAILDRPDDLFPGLATIVRNDPEMMAAVSDMVERNGGTVDGVLGDPSNAATLRAILVPDGFAPPAPGPNPITPLDDLIVAGDRSAIAHLTEQLAAGRAKGPGPTEAPLADARRLARAGVARPSKEWRSSLVAADADFNAPPAAAVVAAPGNRVGLDVLSVLAHGVPGHDPVTVGGTLRLLREIENGNAARMGLGLGLQAEGQRVAREILEQARNEAKRAGIPPEAFRKGLDPAMLAADDVELARSLGRDGILVYDDADPLGSLQYVFKKPPTAAVVQEWSQVPGLAEEFLAGRYEPFATRVGSARIRQALGYVFGPRSNESIALGVQTEFVDRLGRLGVQAVDAKAVWNRWRDVAKASRETEVRGRRGALTGRTVREHMPGDNPLYADVRNIPSRKLDHDAQEALGLVDGLVGPAINHADYDPAYLELLRTIDYGTAFREASSPIRRYLKGEPIQFGRGTPQLSPLAKAPTLGRALAATYGLAAHNKAVTTLYYWFRFALDVRYHAMNYFEAQILYLGRAGLRDGEVSTGMFGRSEGYLRRIDADPAANNTGYATSRSRFAYAYKSFLKEQPDALRGEIRTLERTDPNLMRSALEELAAHDPELVDMIDQAGETPAAYLEALDAWHGKLLEASSIDEVGSTIDEAVAPAIRESPALAEVYGRLADANRDLWANVRETFYGNPDRSRAERFLNSYLLFWPLSYQVKATKWLLRVMFDRAGGVQTNAVGGYAIAQFAQTHQRLLATDAEYGEWFEKHPTLVFMSQMLLPITPDSIGVSLNPILRDLFFERTKAPWEIGPIYTATQIPRLAGEVMADVYPTLGDAPGFDGIYRMLTGRQAPETRGGTAPPRPTSATQPPPWAYKPLWDPANPGP